MRVSHVLVVDDDHTMGEVVVSYLRGDGHTVDESADGERGLDLMRSTTVDLVVLDWTLPEIDGLEVR